MIQPAQSSERPEGEIFGPVQHIAFNGIGLMTVQFSTQTPPRTVRYLDDENCTWIREWVN